MNKFTKVIFLVMFLIISNNSLSLELILSAIKPSYKLGERVDISVSIKNTTGNVIAVPLLFFCEDYYLRMEFPYSKNNKPVFIGAEIDWVESDFDVLWLQHNAEIKSILDLSACYKLGEGRYVFRAVYDTTQRSKVEKVWSGVLTSDEVEIILKR